MHLLVDANPTWPCYRIHKIFHKNTSPLTPDLEAKVTEIQTRLRF